MTEHQHHSEIDQIRQHNSEYQLIVQTWTTRAVFFWVLGSYTTRAPTQVILPPKVQVFSKVRLICRAKSAFGTKMRACGPQSSWFLIAPTCASQGVFYRLKNYAQTPSWCPHRSSTGTISFAGDVAMTRRRCCPHKYIYVILILI